jgi:hypothetical protein
MLYLRKTQWTTNYYRIWKKWYIFIVRVFGACLSHLFARNRVSIILEYDGTRSYYNVIHSKRNTNFNDKLYLNLQLESISGFSGLEVECWPLVPKFAGSNPAKAVGILGRKNPQHAFLRRGSKAVCPMSCLTARKRTQKWRGSRHFRQNSQPFLAHCSTFRCWVR